MAPTPYFSVNVWISSKILSADLKRTFPCPITGAEQKLHAYGHPLEVTMLAVVIRRISGNPLYSSKRMPSYLGIGSALRSFVTPRGGVRRISPLCLYQIPLTPSKEA